MFSFSSSEYGDTRGACLSVTAIIDKLRGLFYLHSHYTIFREKCQYVMENIVKFSFNFLQVSHGGTLAVIRYYY